MLKHMQLLFFKGSTKLHNMIRKGREKGHNLSKDGSLSTPSVMKMGQRLVQPSRAFIFLTPQKKREPENWGK